MPLLVVPLVGATGAGLLGLVGEAARFAAAAFFGAAFLAVAAGLAALVALPLVGFAGEAAAAFSGELSACVALVVLQTNQRSIISTNIMRKK